jgi:hypothetical protein
MGMKTCKCDVCDKPENEFTLFGDLEICNDCFTNLVTVMQYKNFNDMTDNERILLQKFCNKFVKQLLNTNE